MSVPSQSSRPVPLWLHAISVVAVVSTFALFLLGQMVTSFHAGMADPIWPTEPWYLLSNYKFDLGYLIEHTHRIGGFFIGTEVIVLVLCLWAFEPRQVARWIAIAGLLIAIAGYGEFHRGMMAQRELPNSEVRIPMRSVIVTGIGILAVLLVGLSGVFARVRHAGLRMFGLAAFIAVMIQGLLGGFRVKLNELVGTDLAAFHGIFAQVVLSLLVVLAVLTERRSQPTRREDESSERILGRWASVLTLLLFVQIVWGAMIRHNPTPLTQRLHFLTAFLALAVAVLFLRAMFICVPARLRVGTFGLLMVVLLTVQLYLGVEAWLVKFGAFTLPELVPITPETAAIRTLHALIGSGLLMCSLAITARLLRPSVVEIPTQNINVIDWAEQKVPQNRVVEIAALGQGNLP